MLQKIKRILGFIVIFFLIQNASALVYPTPSYKYDLIGHIKIIQSRPKDTLYKIARRYEIGYDELKSANPKLKRKGWLKPKTAVVIPSMFLIPKSPREGLIINLPERRIYFFTAHHDFIITEPIAIGVNGWPTPELDGKIIEKIEDPGWNVPKSIQRERRQKGLPHITYMPPGPKNPLGKYALRLSQRSILIHGTNNIYSIGTRASHGCMRMYPEDIEQLFFTAKLGMPVRIINKPYKVGWQNRHIYLEVHPSLIEYRKNIEERVGEIYSMLLNATHYKRSLIDWHAVKQTVIKQSGIPKIVGGY